MPSARRPVPGIALFRPGGWETAAIFGAGGCDEPGAGARWRDDDVVLVFAVIATLVAASVVR
ncbi:hypothetical protein EFY87_19265 [Flexivirga caeni]|uniref:Uncharacterized protein n=1 Tax=Flexivirga caeni TaxID=2294115 RepID=A0A3M9LWN7_9MICO|nr:hypothetical protein EFY87_19265 [Flexivirga caeni]